MNKTGDSYLPCIAMAHSPKFTWHMQRSSGLLTKYSVSVHRSQADYWLDIHSTYAGVKRMTDQILWVLQIFLKAHSLTMLLRQNLLHKIALEYRGNNFEYKFVTVGKKFVYKFSKMLSDVCFDLSLWWHLPNQDIAFKQIKIVKILKKKLLIVLCSWNIYSQGPNMLWDICFDLSS